MTQDSRQFTVMCFSRCLYTTKTEDAVRIAMSEQTTKHKEGTVPWRRSELVECVGPCMHAVDTCCAYPHVSLAAPIPTPKGIRICAAKKQMIARRWCVSAKVRACMKASKRRRNIAGTEQYCHLHALTRRIRSGITIYNAKHYSRLPSSPQSDRNLGNIDCIR